MNFRLPDAYLNLLITLNFVNPETQIKATVAANFRLSSLHWACNYVTREERVFLSRSKEQLKALENSKRMAFAARSNKIYSVSESSVRALIEKFHAFATNKYGFP